MTTPPTKEPPADYLGDITKAQLAAFGLSLFPYYFDAERAAAFKTDYIYIGWRGTLQNSPSQTSTRVKVE